MEFPLYFNALYNPFEMKGNIGTKWMLKDEGIPVLISFTKSTTVWQ